MKTLYFHTRGNFESISISIIVQNAIIVIVLNTKHAVKIKQNSGFDIVSFIRNVHVSLYYIRTLANKLLLLYFNGIKDAFLIDA